MTIYENAKIQQRKHFEDTTDGIMSENSEMLYGLPLHEVFQKLHEAEVLEASGVPNIPGDEFFDMLREKYGRKAV